MGGSQEGGVLMLPSFQKVFRKYADSPPRHGFAHGSYGDPEPRYKWEQSLSSAGGRPPSPSARWQRWSGPAGSPLPQSQYLHPYEQIAQEERSAASRGAYRRFGPYDETRPPSSSSAASSPSASSTAVSSSSAAGRWGLYEGYHSTLEVPGGRPSPSIASRYIGHHREYDTYEPPSPRGGPSSGPPPRHPVMGPPLPPHGASKVPHSLASYPGGSDHDYPLPSSTSVPGRAAALHAFSHSHANHYSRHSPSAYYGKHPSLPRGTSSPPLSSVPPPPSALAASHALQHAHPPHRLDGERMVRVVGSSSSSAASSSSPAGVPPQVAANTGRWTSQEKRAFLEGLRRYGKDWKSIASYIGTRTALQVRTHAQKKLQQMILYAVEKGHEVDPEIVSTADPSVGRSHVSGELSRPPRGRKRKHDPLIAIEKTMRKRSRDSLSPRESSASSPSLNHLASPSSPSGMAGQPLGRSFMSEEPRKLPHKLSLADLCDMHLA